MLFCSRGNLCRFPSPQQAVQGPALPYTTSYSYKNQAYSFINPKPMVSKSLIQCGAGLRGSPSPWRGPVLTSPSPPPQATACPAQPPRLPTMTSPVQTRVQTRSRYGHTRRQEAPITLQLSATSQSALPPCQCCCRGIIGTSHRLSWCMLLKLIQVSQESSSRGLDEQHKLLTFGNPVDVLSVCCFRCWSA